MQTCETKSESNGISFAPTFVSTQMFILDDFCYIIFKCHPSLCSDHIPFTSLMTIHWTIEPSITPVLSRDYGGLGGGDDCSCGSCPGVVVPGSYPTLVSKSLEINLERIQLT